MGGSKTAILAQVVYFYFNEVGHITIGGDSNVLNITLSHQFPELTDSGLTLSQRVKIAGIVAKHAALQFFVALSS